jgi:fermentation-respiration switch protein FrsA (DUF1100 family)
MALESHCFYLKFFLENGINVFTWNYRNYGKSGGRPSPQTLRSDIDAVFEYLRKELKLSGKLGVYGRSLGGISSSHLCGRADMVLFDRTFSSFD